MIAVIVVRDGVLPAGADEAICEAGRRSLLVGSSTSLASSHIENLSISTWVMETESSLASTSELVSVVKRALDVIASSEASGEESIILPASPDGRDLAPRLAFDMGRQLFSGALEISDERVTIVQNGGRHLVDHRPTTPFVATLQIGVRGADTVSAPHRVIVLEAPARANGTSRSAVESVEVSPPDASTMDLSEADKIVGGGAGLDEAAFAKLGSLAAALGASMGVTRVITDRGWAEHTRQIGTTGIVVDPRLYLAFGISGAVQHTSGLGSPDHIISVNTDPHCPMMQISDVAIVSDANAVLDALCNVMQVAESGAGGRS